MDTVSTPTRSLEFRLSTWRVARIIVELDDGTRLTFPVEEPPEWADADAQRTLRLEASPARSPAATTR